MNIGGLQLRGEILTKNGYHVALESDPVQALRRDLLAFDLAIVDYEMPGLNGVELLFAMRAMLVPYPIILLSGAIDGLDVLKQRLFYQCLKKADPVTSLLNVIDSYVRASLLPDLSCYTRCT